MNLKQELEGIFDDITLNSDDKINMILQLFQVPELEWVENDAQNCTDEGEWNCDYGFIDFTIGQEKHGSVYWVHWLGAEDDVLERDFVSLPEAQEACRQHLQSLVWQALGVEDETKGDVSEGMKQ